LENVATIYGLYDPDTDELRYVGKTVRTPRRRMLSHRDDAKSKQRYLYNWWRSCSSDPIGAAKYRRSK
jgi:hypothetical protein